MYRLRISRGDFLPRASRLEHYMALFQLLFLLKKKQQFVYLHIYKRRSIIPISLHFGIYNSLAALTDIRRQIYSHAFHVIHIIYNALDLQYCKCVLHQLQPPDDVIKLSRFAHVHI